MNILMFIFGMAVGSVIGGLTILVGVYHEQAQNKDRW